MFNMHGAVTVKPRVFVLGAAADEAERVGGLGWVGLGWLALGKLLWQY